MDESGDHDVKPSMPWDYKRDYLGEEMELWDGMGQMWITGE